MPLKHVAAIAVAALLALAPGAHAQNTRPIPFPDVVNKAPAATPSEIQNGNYPFVSGGAAKKIPGPDVLTTTGQQRITNKTIDCGSNTCMNFPGGGGTGTGSGDVSGPASATSGHLPTFGDTTGKALTDSGVATTDLTVSNGGTFIPPTACPQDGAVYNNNGSIAICGGTVIHVLGLNSGGAVGLNVGGAVQLNQ